MLLTNNVMQTELQSALNVIEEQQNHPHNELQQLRLQILHDMLMLMKLSSASGNSIPGLRGLGADEGFALAQQINTQGVNKIDIPFLAFFEKVNLIP